MSFTASSRSAAPSGSRTPSRSGLLRHTAIAALLAPALSVPVAHAQSDPAAVEPFDEVVVTARRVDETLIEAPVAVTALSETAIENLGLQSIDDVARHTAGFSFSNAFGRSGERPVIRGAANILANVQFGVEAGAAYFIDGVYYNGTAQALDLKNLERVEVVKGAQSALYGRNTYSGAINYITKRPSAGGQEGSVEVTYAEDGEYDVYGRYSNSIGDGALGFSLSGRFYEYGGDDAFINEVDGAQLGEEQSLSVNGVIDVNFSDRASSVLRVGYSEDDDGPRPFRVIGAENNNCFPGYRSPAFYDPNYLAFLSPPFSGIFPNSVTSDNNFQYFCGDLSDFEDLAPAQNLDGVPFIGVEREQLYVNLLNEFELGDGWQLAAQFGLRDEELTTGSDSDHQSGSINFFPISPFFSIPLGAPLFSTSDQGDIFDYSAEVRLRSPADRRLRFSVGGFYYDYENEGRSLSNAAIDPVANPRGISLLEDRQGIENIAVFATLDYDITDRFDISLEGRYQEETKSLVELDGGPDAPATYAEEVTFDDFIPKVILGYDINSDMSAYASYARGVKPGGINGPIGIAAGNEFYAPEESDNFEIGFKGRYPDGRGQVTVAAFYNDISAYQLTTPVGGAGFVNSVATNQGSAEILGIEIETNYDLTDYINVGGSYAFNDAEFTEGCDDFQFVLNSGGYLGAPFDPLNPPTTLNIRGGGASPVFDTAGLFTGNLSCSIAGNQIPLTSEHQGSLFAFVDVPVSDTWNAFLNADYTYESSKFVQVHNGAETGDTNIFSGQVGLKSDGLRLELFGRNLFNERTPPAATRWFDVFEGFNTISSQIPGATSVDRSALGPRSFFLSYRRGRQIGARVRLDF